MVPSKEGFIANANLPNMSNVNLPQMKLWNQQIQNKNFTEKKVSFSSVDKENNQDNKDNKEEKLPVIAHVYIGALTALGLYVLYRFAKR